VDAVGVLLQDVVLAYASLRKTAFAEAVTVFTHAMFVSEVQP